MSLTPATIMDGRKVSSERLLELGYEVALLTSQFGRAPGLAVVLVGDHGPSEAYVGMKKKACESIGIASFDYRLRADQDEADLVSCLDALNADPRVDGILLQLPLPNGFDEDKMVQRISPDKDVDGFHPMNVGKLLLGLETFVSCTPYGVCVLLEAYNIPVEGKHVVIVGRSNIVGKPLAALLLQKQKIGNATVTVCHSKSENLADITQSADILIAAMGVPRFIKADMVKPGAVVIDVGTSREVLPDGRKILIGDVDYDAVAPIASAITPVPGGVGPMTIAMLMSNTVTSFKRRMGA